MAAEEAAFGPKLPPATVESRSRSFARRYSGRLYGLGLALLGNAGLAEKLVHRVDARDGASLLVFTKCVFVTRARPGR